MGNARIVNTPAQAIPQNGTTHIRTNTNDVSSIDFDEVFSTPVNPQTTHVLIQFHGGTVNATFDGITEPTIGSQGIGFRYLNNTSAYIPIDMFKKVKMISQTGTVFLEIQELNYR